MKSSLKIFLITSGDYMGEYLPNLAIKFGLIIARLSAFFITAPFYSSIQIPMPVKAGLAVFCTLVLFPLVGVEGFTAPGEPLLIVILGVNEIICGLLLGFSLYVTFACIQLAGELIDLRMGFALVNVLDPQSGENIPLVGQFKSMLATLVFLAVYGHHYLLKGLFNSYKLVPLGSYISVNNSIDVILRICGNIFLLAFQMALPVIACLFIVDISFGFLARTIPQINIFSVGLPTKILLGILILCLALPNLVLFLEKIFQSMYEGIDLLLKGLGG